MISIENINFLRQRLHFTFEDIKRIEQAGKATEYMLLRQTPSGQVTLSKLEEEREWFLHSRYYPEYEANCFVEQYAEEKVNAYKYVLFYGIGLGYHIEAFARQFPGSTLILYWRVLSVCFFPLAGHFADKADQTSVHRT